MITDEMKKQIETKVKLDYCYRMTEYAIAKLYKIAEVLKKHNLKPKVADGCYWGPCKTLHCNGFISLYEADLIVNELHEVKAFSTVIYSDGNFTLITDNER